MTDEATTTLPEGDYAIVEQLGHRTLVGRISEVERFGAKLMQIEPIYQGKLLDPVLIGSATLYAFTPCSMAVAAKRGPTLAYQLPPSIVATLPVPALMSPTCDDIDEDDDQSGLPDFLTE